MSAILAAILDFSKILFSEIPTPGDEKTGDFTKIKLNYSKYMGSWSSEKLEDYRKCMENLAGRW